MKWSEFLSRMLQFAPVVVYGVEKVMADAPGATKKDVAVSILTHGAEVAGAIAPNQQPAVEAVRNAAGAIIDATVAIANATGDLKHKAPQTAPVA